MLHCSSFFAHIFYPQVFKKQTSQIDPKKQISNVLRICIIPGNMKKKLLELVDPDRFFKLAQFSKSNNIALSTSSNFKAIESKSQTVK